MRQKEYFFFSLASVTFLPYNFLTTDIYSILFSKSDLPFKFQIYFQAISWVLWGYYLLAKLKNERLNKVFFNKKVKYGLIAYFVLTLIIWPFANFKIISLVLIPPLLIPIAIGPFWIMSFSNKAMFMLASIAVAMGYISFFSHLMSGNVYLIGHTVFIFSMLAFFDLMAAFINSTQRDQSAGGLLKNLLPRPIYGKLSTLLDRGANVESIREQLSGDATITTIFIDICAYGEMSLKLSSKVMARSRLEVFDFLSSVIEKYDHYFVKSIGDSIHFASGFFEKDGYKQSDLATNCLYAVKEILDRIDEMNVRLKDLDLPSVKIKISATIGHGEFGLEGTRSEIRYDILGHWLNVAKRLEDGMNTDFYKEYGYNCALVSTNLFAQCSDITLRQRFFIPFEVTDKHGIKYPAYIGQQYEKQVEKEDFFEAIYGQFSHDEFKKNKKAS